MEELKRLVVITVPPPQVDAQEDPICREPVAGPVVQPSRPKEGPVRGLVHHDRQAELAGSDQKEREHDGQHVGNERDECEARHFTNFSSKMQAVF